MWPRLIVVSFTPCGVAVVLVMVVVLVVRLQGDVEVLGARLQHNPGSKIQGSGGGDSKMRVFDGILSATSPHLLTRWRVQRVYLGR